MSTLYAVDTFAGDGSTTNFDLTFEYIERDHVTVTLINTDQSEVVLTVVTSGSPGTTEYKWSDDNTIQVGQAPTAGQQLQIKRTTPVSDQIVKWADGSYITAEDLNTSDEQFLYLIQELDDRVAADEASAVGEAPDDGALYGRQSKAWQPVPAPGIGEAPIDNKEYVRVNQSWKEIPEDQTGVPEAPINTKTFGRKDASWVEISSTGGIVYKGTRDLRQAAPTAVAGDFYVNTATSGVVDASWTGLGGEALTGAERVVYNGSSWEMLPMPPLPSGVVEEIVAGSGITVNSSDSAKPVVSVTNNSFIPLGSWAGISTLSPGFNPSTGTLSNNSTTTVFNQGKSSEVGLTSTEKTTLLRGGEVPYCDSWCLSSKGYTSTWKITPEGAAVWAYINSCAIAVCPKGPSFSVYGCLYEPNGDLVGCTGDQLGNSCVPIASGASGIATSVNVYTFDVVIDGVSKQVVPLPDGTKSLDKIALIGGTGTGYIIQPRRVETFEYDGNSAPGCLFENLVVVDMGDGYQVSNILEFKTPALFGTEFGVVTAIED